MLVTHFIHLGQSGTVEVSLSVTKRATKALSGLHGRGRRGAVR